ncbi:hypothetical protein Br6_04946 [Rhodococcus sp. Br-6]|nr:hypothetical protein Br6_04946 [Rhodococcus sp. Br-6]
MASDNRTPMTLRQYRRYLAVRKCIASAVLVVCGIVLLFVAEVPAMAAATIAGSGVMGVALFGSELVRRPAAEPSALDATADADR